MPQPHQVVDHVGTQCIQSVRIQAPYSMTATTGCIRFSPGPGRPHSFRSILTSTDFQKVPLDVEGTTLSWVVPHSCTVVETCKDLHRGGALGRLRWGGSPGCRALSSDRRWPRRWPEAPCAWPGACAQNPQPVRSELRDSQPPLCSAQRLQHVESAASCPARTSTSWPGGLHLLPRLLLGLQLTHCASP